MSTRHGSSRKPGLRFGRRELLDLGAAWVAMSVAFAIFVGRPARVVADPGFAVQLVAISAVTVGVAFLLHELGHKVVAVRYGQVAAFRADYGMLLVAIVSALAGFIFAAPGAVRHYGPITDRQNGLVALAGPAVNLALVALFAPLLLLPEPLWTVGAFGVLVNAVLAGFNMLPYGPLDGKTVYEWHRGVFAVTSAVSVGLAVLVVLAVGFPEPP